MFTKPAKSLAQRYAEVTLRSRVRIVNLLWCFPEGAIPHVSSVSSQDSFEQQIKGIFDPSVTLAYLRVPLREAGYEILEKSKKL